MSHTAPLRIIPVLDVQNRQAVHALGGDRRAYPPLRTLLCQGCDPRKVAVAFQQRLGLDHLYLADLDAIAGSPPDHALYQSIGARGTSLTLDPGLRDAHGLDAFFGNGVATLIAATETLRGPLALQSIVAGAPRDSIMLSLDLDGLEPVVAADSDWKTRTIPEIITRSRDAGVNRFLILDRSRIGSNHGPALPPLVMDGFRNVEPTEIIVGGGVRGLSDLLDLASTRVHAVLVGSAIHDGRIDRRSIESLRRPQPGSSTHATSAD